MHISVGVDFSTGWWHIAITIYDIIDYAVTWICMGGDLRLALGILYIKFSGVVLDYRYAYNMKFYLLLATSLAATAFAQNFSSSLGDEHCKKCIEAMPCIDKVYSTGKAPDANEAISCQCNDQLFSVYESECLQCSLFKQSSQPLPSLNRLKDECAAAKKATSNAISSFDPTNVALAVIVGGLALVFGQSFVESCDAIYNFQAPTYKRAGYQTPKYSLM
ncbi:hypothetical protein K493DRAFT_349927 [Basidiobolus meristosporus CBS 931.73]|uniref:Uncharacterized protein n=1 Tax=Basidiobolus meristosporus CBS 931.73 TaxID=1314790 RepID=A0A1Y1YI65_9FUNG|nr:hypothetical protein K493DRAFT_349927 [Basidiobolus meristosporus CBS 931.73]|eukprot:ORX97669.1 hypothetical protein K493DRAFT_349927 [Basidiobolus meristosporus CBS 931.73]